MMKTPLALAAALALALAACGGDTDDTTDTTDTGMVEDSGTTTDTDVEEDTTPVDPASHVDATYRITSISISEPSSLGTILGALMNGDIRTQKLNVLIDFRGFSGTSGEVTFEMTGNGGATTETDGEYTWHETVNPEDIQYAPSQMAADGTFANTETMSLDFPGIQPNTDPVEIFIIPIKDLSLTGQVFDDDGVLMDAQLQGAILLEDAEEIEFRLSPSSDPQTLAELLSSVDMDYPEEGEGATGWTMAGQIIAEPVILVP